MRRQRITRRTTGWAALALGLGLAACESPTAVEPVSATARTVTLSSEAERSAWPVTPTVQGGPNILVRTTAMISCARPIASAVRRANVIEVHIAGDPPTSICLAVVAGWQPVEATILGLSAGTYRVRVTAVGHVGRADWRVVVSPP